MPPIPPALTVPAAVPPAIPAADLPLRLALQRAPLLGAVTLRQLMEYAGPPETWYHHTDAHLQRGVSIHQWNVLAALLAGDPWRYPGVAADLEWLDHDHNHVVFLDQADYPLLLRQIHDAPFLLFVRGDTDALSLPQLALVGSRHPTRSGIRDCQDFATELCRQGFAITSGLALGIDGIAHASALQAGGTTVAVLAHGLHQTYPGRHRHLAEQIVCGGGALVSEWSTGIEPRPEFFPRRNRVISGLSLGVLVVEAAMQSGSLITAREALDQGREVFAIPGSIHNPLSRGCHRLIRQGAKLVETAADVVEDLGPLLSMLLPGLTAAARERGVVLPDTATALEKRLLDEVLREPASIDTLVDLTGHAAPEISAALAMLEVDGHVIQVQGQYLGRGG